MAYTENAVCMALGGKWMRPFDLEVSILGHLVVLGLETLRAKEIKLSVHLLYIRGTTTMPQLTYL